MSFGSKPKTVTDDPYRNMPDWVREYYQNQISRAGASDERADALRLMFSGFTPTEMDFVQNHQGPQGSAPAPMSQTESTQAALSALVRGLPGNDRPDRVDTMPAWSRSGGLTPQEAYDQQMAQSRALR